jgi:hypothetical protein
MKIKIIAIAMGVSLAVSAARGTPNTLYIIESGGETLSVNFNGKPPSFATINPPVDDWTIVFSEGWTIDLKATMSDPIELGEPESTGIPTINKIFSDDPTTIHFQSDVMGLTEMPLVITLKGALISPEGGIFHGQRFDIVFADVPELSSTISIFGIALAGLAWFARFRRRAM